MEQKQAQAEKFHDMHTFQEQVGKRKVSESYFEMSVVERKKAKIRTNLVNLCF